MDSSCFKGWFGWLLVFTCAVSLSRPAIAEQGSGDVVCPNGQVCRVTLTKMPLLALPRPFSNLYKSAAADKSQIIRENVPAFIPFYVFARPDGAAMETGQDLTGWYQVGTSVRSPLGWMQAKDIFEWRQALVVSYKHWGVGDEARQRVMMFKDLPSLSTIVESPTRDVDAKSLYEQLSKNTVPPNVISIEPDSFVDIDQKFYLFPILDFKEVNKFDNQALCLLLATAVPNGRAAPGEAAAAAKNVSSGLPESKVLAELADADIDVVFVVDMTASMEQWIAGIKSAMTDIARSISRDEKVNRRLRFGFVGYRDNVSMMPGLEWTTHNFTPQLVADLQFINLVGDAHEARVTSGDYPEEVYAGVKAGIDSAWRPNSIRFLVQIGDASAHEPGHRQNTTGDLDARALRLLENEQKITALSIHLRDSRAQPDWSVAQAQFEALTRNPGTEKETMYFPVPAEDPNAYAQVVKDIAGHLSALVDGSKSSAVQRVATSNPAPQPAASAPVEDEVSKKVDKAIAAALITYLGKDATPPRDVKAWAFDRDLIDPRKSALDVKVLMSKDDLDNLITALEIITDGMKEIKVTNMGLFDTLQGLSANVMKNREEVNFAGAQNLAATKLLPGFIASLPYKSVILSLSSERYAAMTTEEQAELQRHLTGDLAFYRQLHNSPNVWTKLSKDDSDGESVNAVSLVALP